MTAPLRLKIFPNRAILALDVLGATAWTYTFFKLFVVDVDRYLLKIVAPSLLWTLEFRVIAVAASALLVLLLLRGKKFAGSAIYVLAFPLILLIWKIPFLILKMGNWVSRLAAINVILSTFTDIRYKLGWFVLYTTSIVSILYVHNITSALLGISVTLMCVCASYGRAFAAAFKAPKVLRLYKRIFEWVQREDPITSPKSRVNAPLSTLPEDTSQQLVQSLQTSVFINRVCVFFSNKLKEYNKSEVHIISGLTSIASLSVITLVSFAILYKAATIVDPSSIEGSANLTTFNFIYIAFDNMFFGTNSSSQLLAPASQFLSMCQRALSTALIAVFAAVLLEIRRRKNSREIDDAIEAAEKAAGRVEAKVIAEYSYSDINEAMQDLSKIESSFYATVIKFLGSVKI